MEHENIELKQRLKELECKTTHMGTEKDRIVKEHKASLKNFSSLLETAKIELDRKDRQIKEGRKKYTIQPINRSVIPCYNYYICLLGMTTCVFGELMRLSQKSKWKTKAFKLISISTHIRDKRKLNFL